MNMYFKKSIKLENGLVCLQQDFHNTFVDYYDNQSSTLVIAFNPMPPSKDATRMGWGFNYFYKLGLSIISVKAKFNDWYRGQDLIEFFISDELKTILDRYKKVVFTGVSMGGFGALTFSAIVPQCTVIAHCPQTTLNRSKVPWETRFGISTLQSWEGLFHDAYEGAKNAKAVYISYDPFLRLDRLHVERLYQENLVKLKVPFVGHAVPESLRDMGLLKRIFETIVLNGHDITEAKFFEWAKSRRQIERYYVMISKRLKSDQAKYALFTKAKELNPKEAAFNFHIARLLLSFNNVLEAMDVIEEAISIDNSVARFHALKSNILMRLNEKIKARKSIKKAIELDPKNSRYKYLFSKVCNDLNLIEEALLAIEEAMALDPKNAHYAFIYSNTLEALGKHELALEKMEEAVELVQDNIPYQVQYANMLSTHGKLQEAYVLMEGVVGKEPKNAHYKIKLANILLGLGKKDEACRLVEAAVLLEPNNEHYKGKLLKLNNKG